MKKIKLTQGKYALVDDEDFEYLNQFKWCTHKRRDKFAAVRRLPKSEGFKNILMHTFIMQTKPVDHIDGNPLNNQRNNLRACTHTENACNRGVKRNNKSGFKGVYKNSSIRAKPWIAEVKKGPVRIRKSFITKMEAVKFYREVALKLHKEFARFK